VLRVEIDVGGRWHETESLDVSLGGVCLLVPATLDELPSAVPLRLHLPTGASFGASARLRWRNGDEAGLQFESVPPEELLLLARWLKGDS